MTPDPNASAKALRYKWEPCRDTIGWQMHCCFQPRQGHTFAQTSLLKCEVYRDNFSKHRGQGRCDFPEHPPSPYSGVFLTAGGGLDRRERHLRITQNDGTVTLCTCAPPL